MATEPAADFSLDSAAAVAAAEGESARVEGLGPWQLAWRRLRRNRVAMSALAVFLVIFLACFVFAPLYSNWVGRTSDQQNVTGKIERGGKQVDVVSPDGTPIGAALSKNYPLGADRLGRDVSVRLLYGGRSSLIVGFGATAITIIFSLSLGLLAGYFGGATDRVISSVFDIIWSFPVLLLAIALGTALAISGLNVGPIHLESDSLWIPIIIIGAVYIPYLGRPVRGQVLALREKEFVEAATAQGMRPIRIMFAEILPNLSSTILVFGTLIVANDILTEAGLSFLGVGVQPPTPSWGNLIADGSERIATAPHLALVPGLAIAITVLSLNLFGDGLRDALDPRAKVRLR